MAQVKWQKRAENELYRYLVKGFLEFGETAANAFSMKVASINNELRRFPEVGYPEPLLSERKKLYRAKHIIGRFKIIYYYDSLKDIVHIADIWDTRRDPQKLTNRIK
jgi:plasmid stabilization system protein ParE